MDNQQLIDAVLPRLARRLQRQLKRYHEGQLDDAGFYQNFEDVLKRQYDLLASQGVAEDDAAVIIHGAILVLSNPGLRAEAEQLEMPLEVVEFNAVRLAAEDLSRNYELDLATTLRRLTSIVARHAK
jgi:hypothetical protein